MTVLAWVLLGVAVALFLAVPVVRRVLNRRIRAEEATLTRDFNTALDAELPELFDEE